MKRLLTAGCLTSLLLLSLALPFPVAEGYSKPVVQVGPLNLSGELYGAPYRIRVPAVWNGTLLVYAHGYRDKADHPGEIDNRNADIAPNGALESALLAQGYAIAGSAYRDNGWAVAEGIEDTKEVATLFRSLVGQPDRTILWSVSLGSIIGLESMERFGGIYDGALCMCAPAAGSTRVWDTGVGLYLAYDVVFGTPLTWGTVGEVRNDIDFETEVFPKLLGEVTVTANFPKFEFIRLVGGNPGRGITAPSSFYPGWLFTDMAFLTEYRAELQRRAGGPFVQNLNHTYSLTAAEKSYLMGFGIPSAVIDGWLGQMNSRRNIDAAPGPRNYVEHYATFNGKIKSPVLTMHTIVDPLVVVANESAYSETIAAAGRSNQLFQTYTTGNGHCAFTGPQILTAVNAIDTWVRNGTKPTAATFPAALGFAPTFVPPPFPQP